MCSLNLEIFLNQMRLYINKCSSYYFLLNTSGPLHKRQAGRPGAPGAPGGSGNRRYQSNQNNQYNSGYAGQPGQPGQPG